MRNPTLSLSSVSAACQPSANSPVASGMMIEIMSARMLALKGISLFTLGCHPLERCDLDP